MIIAAWVYSNVEAWQGVGKWRCTQSAIGISRVYYALHDTLVFYPVFKTVLPKPIGPATAFFFFSVLVVNF